MLSGKGPLNTKLPVMNCSTSDTNYAKKDQVIEIHRLIESWPLLSPENALQLFDYAYPDEHVRKFAVHCFQVKAL